jgi:hypothetical protein
MILKQQDEKPRIDPFIVMEDICEKLRLMDYENTFCKKYKKGLICKFYFATACNSNLNNGNKVTQNNNNTNQTQSLPQQFIIFYELSYWLMLLVKQVLYLIYISFFFCF